MCKLFRVYHEQYGQRLAFVPSTTWAYICSPVVLYRARAKHDGGLGRRIFFLLVFSRLYEYPATCLAVASVKSRTSRSVVFVFVMRDTAFSMRKLSMNTWEAFSTPQPNSVRFLLLFSRAWRCRLSKWGGGEDLVKYGEMLNWQHRFLFTHLDLHLCIG